MPAEDPSQTAVEWASTVSARDYQHHRDDLDRLVLAVEPTYEAAVHGRLEEFESLVTAARERYDERHSGAQFVRPWRLRWAQYALFWAFFLGITGSFAFMYPAGRAGGADFSRVDWAQWVMFSSICFAVGVVAQLLRRLPVRRGIPPRRDLSWFPTALGVPTIGMMIWHLNFTPGTEPGWIVLTGASLAVSIAYSITRITQRRSDPELTREVDLSEKKRMRIWANNLEAQAEQCADRIERDFAELPEAQRQRVLAELTAARTVLQQRGLIRTWDKQKRSEIARRRFKRLGRPMVPGFLLLERRSQELWKPYGSEPGMVLPARWRVVEYLPAQR